MYCPKCGQQQVSEQVRFCSRCGFALDGVKACLGGDDEAIAIFTPPRQRNINVGVILMFIATLFASWITFDSGLGPAGGFVLLVAAFASLLLFSRPVMRSIYKLISWEEPPPGQISARRREMSFGSTFMFIGAIMSGFATSLAPGHMQDTTFFFSLITIFLLLLVTSHHLMRGVINLLTDEEAQLAINARAEQRLITEGASVLSTSQSAPATASGKQRFTTGELLSPPSVTEQTTNLLENE